MNQHTLWVNSSLSTAVNGGSLDFSVQTWLSCSLARWIRDSKHSKAVSSSPVNTSPMGVYIL